MVADLVICAERGIWAFILSMDLGIWVDWRIWVTGLKRGFGGRFADLGWEGDLGIHTEVYAETWIRLPIGADWRIWLSGLIGGFGCLG